MEGTRLGLVRLIFLATTNFELKGKFLNLLKESPLYGKDHKDSHKHIDEVLDIVDHFNIPGVLRDTFMLRVLPITFKYIARR